MVFILLFAFTSFAQTETPNPGPRSTKEAKILLEESHTALDQKDYKAAVTHLKRFIQRYPLDSSFVEAHLLLGQAHAQLNEMKEAIAPLRNFIQHHFYDDFGNQARLLLTEAYISVGRLSEARGVVDELLKQKITQPTRQKALLMKAWVLTLQKKLNDAKASLDSFDSKLNSNALDSSAPRSELEQKVKFIYKTVTCSELKLPGAAKNKDEPAWLDHLTRVKNCFLESLIAPLDAASEQWCITLKDKEAELIRESKDKSFVPKIKTTLQDVKSTALEKSKELLKCYDHPAH